MNHSPSTLGSFAEDGRSEMEDGGGGRESEGEGEGGREFWWRVASGGLLIPVVFATVPDEGGSSLFDFLN